VSQVSFLPFADGHVEEGLELRRAIAGEVRRARPELVAAVNHRERWGSGGGSPWNFADHRAVGRATIDAVYDAANEWIFPDLAIDDGLPPWSGTRHIAIFASGDPTHAVSLDADHVERAVLSLLAHRRYLEALGAADAEQYARGVVDAATATDGPGRSVGFELLNGPGRPPRARGEGDRNDT
jgi:LmbE family N-acetylglucosaminyl deacetylase